MRYWLKLVGTANDPVDEQWAHTQPSLLERVDFPRHRKPNGWYRPNGVIAYAVGTGRIYAVQHVTEPPFVKPAGDIRTGERWPHNVAVATSAYVCPLAGAPTLADDATDIWERYGGRKLWQQSHIAIERDEFERLETLIRLAPESVLEAFREPGQQGIGSFPELLRATASADEDDLAGTLSDQIELDADIEEIVDAFSIRVGTRGMTLPYPFELDGLWTILDELDDLAIGALEEE